MNKDSISLSVGDNEQLTAAVGPENAFNKDVTWSSSNSKVATVKDCGLVTAVGPGTVTITATAHNGINVTCTVTVAYIPVTGVKLNKESTSLPVGAEETLTATIAPANASNKAVTWTCDNTKVASVDNNGKVVGAGPGFTIITVTTADGGKIAVCKVKVTGPVMEFSDVAANAWYAPYVYDLVSLGIINGKGEGIFDPQGKITRGEFAKILATASGDDLDQYEGKTSFNDVVTGKWFSNPIEWAYQNGIVQGKGDGIYAPTDNISRQDIAVMIVRYADYKGITLPEIKPAVTFADDAEIGFWAKDAVAAMQKAGIIDGKGDNIFAPKDNATRAEAAKMISVFLNM